MYKRQALRGAGFGSTSTQCTADSTVSGDNDRIVTGTNPAAGTVVNRNTQITVEFKAKNCGGRP